MFKVNEDLSIHVTRGDSAVLGVAADENGTNYTFKEGDVVRLKVFEKKNCDEVVLQKDTGANAGAKEVEITLSGEDTKLGKVISKPVDYWYEIELNPDTNPKTLIGYDEDGAKVFRVYPEGGDVE